MHRSGWTGITGGALREGQEVGKLIMTAIDYPPMQKGASFNLDAVKAKVEAAMAHHGQWPERQPKKGQEFLALLLQDASVCQVE